MDGEELLDGEYEEPGADAGFAQPVSEGSLNEAQLLNGVESQLIKNGPLANSSNYRKEYAAFGRECKIELHASFDV